MARAKANPVPLLPVLLGGGAVAAFLAYKHFGKGGAAERSAQKALAARLPRKTLASAVTAKKPTMFDAFKGFFKGKSLFPAAAPAATPAAPAKPQYDLTNPYLIELEPALVSASLSGVVVPGDAIRFIAQGQEGNVGPGGSWREMEWIDLKSSNPSVIEKAKIMRKDMFVVRNPGKTVISGSYNDIKVGKVTPISVEVVV